MKKTVIGYSVVAVLTLMFAIFLNWLTLPAWNLSSSGIYWYGIFVLAFAAVGCWIVGYQEDLYLPAYITSGIAVGIFVIWLIGIIAGSPLFHAYEYYQRLAVEESTFENAIPSLTWDQVPKVDHESAKKLANTQLGTLNDDLVSQYELEDYQTLINISEQPYRVSPLGHAGLFKYNQNKFDGAPGLVKVNAATQEQKYVELEENLIYSKSSFFARDLKRHLRSMYPSTLFSSTSFELDDNNKGYFVTSTYVATAGIGGCKVPTGVILLDPNTGKTSRYDQDEIPTWIDHGADKDILISMADSWGLYKNGYWITTFVGSQKGCKETSEGSTYLAFNNDVYIYTGITSLTNDASNVGFILINMRTTEAKFISCSAAYETAAQKSAEGKVQDLGYKATFPLLLNSAGVKTYFMSLKDNDGLVKMYAFVDVEDLQIVSCTDVSEGIEAASAAYLKLLTNKVSVDSSTIEELTIKIDELAVAQIEGNSVYYIVSNGKLFVANIKVGQNILPLVKLGETLQVKCIEAAEIYTIVEISK